MPQAGRGRAHAVAALASALGRSRPPLPTCTSVSSGSGKNTTCPLVMNPCLDSLGHAARQLHLVCSSALN